MVCSFKASSYFLELCATFTPTVLHREFYQAQAQDVGVEIDIRLRITCDRGHMVDSEDLFVHLLPPPDLQIRPSPPGLPV